METPLIGGDIAFRQHAGGHTPGPNWPTFLTFASRYLHAPGQASAGDPAAVHLTAAQDRERMLGLLGLKDSDMRKPPAVDAKAPNATNYDESKANVYTNIPDPLRMKNGQPVTSPEMWFDQRRPEIVADYEREILGRAPANLPRVTWEVVSTTPEKYGGVGRDHQAPFGPRRQLFLSADLRQHRSCPHHPRQDPGSRSGDHGACFCPRFRARRGPAPDRSSLRAMEPPANGEWRGTRSLKRAGASPY